MTAHRQVEYLPQQLDVSPTYTTFLTDPSHLNAKMLVAAFQSFTSASFWPTSILGCTQAPDPAALSLDIKDKDC